MSDLKNPGVPIWSCTFADPQTGSDKLDNLTVGSKFAMSCRGEIPVEWEKTAPTVSFAKPEDEFSLVILRDEKLDAKEALFTVTGYKPGEHKPEYIRILQGERGFEVAHPTWTIKSVLKPNEEAKPFGPFGPFSVALPLWVWGALALILVLIAVRGVAWGRDRWRRRNIKAQLKLHATPLTPAHQFYRDARAIRKRLHAVVGVEDLKAILGELDQSFRRLLLRQYKIAALEGGEAVVIGEMRRRRAKVLAAVNPELGQMLRELGRLMSQPTITLSDVEQLHRMSVTCAEKIERVGGGA